MVPNDAEGMANGVDPKSDLGLHCLRSSTSPKTWNIYGDVIGTFTEISSFGGF